MIQEIAPYTFNSQYYSHPPSPESCVLYFEKNTILVQKKEDGTFNLPAFAQLDRLETQKSPNSATDNAISGNYTYLFSIDEQTFYLAEKIKPLDNFTLEPVADVMKTNPRHLAFAVVTGFQLFKWYDGRKYCGRCKTALIKSEKSRALSCPSCKQREYPKIAPAVIIGVTNGSKLLLARYPDYDRYALLAGFSEIGETLEETVKRETMEEVGLKVKNIRYYKSQPWSVSDNLLAGFFCDVDESDEISIDESELKCAKWFERKDIPLGDYEDGSLTFEMMDVFKKGKV